MNGKARKLARARTGRSKGCKKCVWFHPLVDQDGEATEWGTCQVAPPRATAESKWPRVHGNAWCGAFMPLWGEDDRGLWMDNGEEG